MSIQDQQGRGSTFHLMHTLLSYSQLEQTPGYIQTQSQFPQLCFDMLQWNHLLGQWEHHSWLEKGNKLLFNQSSDLK